MVTVKVERRVNLFEWNLLWFGLIDKADLAQNEKQMVGKSE